MSLTLPPGTGLAFHRKRQTVDCLVNERPQSLQSFYDVMTEAIQEVELRLHLTEKGFYGEYGTPEREIKHWLPAINTVLKATRVPTVQSMAQLEQINFHVKELGQAKAVDECLMDQVYQSVNKTLGCIKTEFGPLTNEVQRLADFVSKYCLSFADSTKDPYMETVIAYQRQINDFKETVRKYLENIQTMVSMFHADGLQFVHFRDSDVAGIGYKAECTHAAYLLIFPEACENIRLALKALLKWVEEDKTYAGFVRVDMSDLEKQKIGRAKHLRDVQQRSFQLDFKVKACKKLLSDMYEEFEKLKDKECHFVEEEKQLMDEHREIALDLELKALRKDNLKREATRLSSREFNEKNERLIFETSALKDRLQVLTRRLDEMRTKTKWLTTKRELRKAKEMEVGKLKKELKLVKKEVRIAEVELNRVDTCLNKLKQIYIFKTSPDVLKKIFHNIPLDTKKKIGGTQSKVRGEYRRGQKIQMVFGVRPTDNALDN